MKHSRHRLVSSASVVGLVSAAVLMAFAPSIPGSESVLTDAEMAATMGGSCPGGCGSPGLCDGASDTVWLRTVQYTTEDGQYCREVIYRATAPCLYAAYTNMACYSPGCGVETGSYCPACAPGQYVEDPPEDTGWHCCVMQA